MHCAHSTLSRGEVQLLVDAHDLLHGVDVDSRGLGVHALHPLFAHHHTVALGHREDIDHVAEHVVQHDALLARVREKMLSDAIPRHVDLQMLAQCLAEEGRTISDDDKRWDDRTDRMTFEVQKGDTTVRSVWTNSVRNAFRKQAGWAKLQKVRATAATHWTERVWYRHNQRWLQASKEGAEASKSGSFKDEREWGKKCFEDLDQRRLERPATSTWRTSSSEKDQAEKRLESG